MNVKIKTAFKKDGTLLANQVHIIADSGAYASLGGPVLDLALEHASGPYKIPHVKLDGFLVYTNNSISGPMRGFGANQVCFAMEAQMDAIATMLNMDPLELRIKNALKQGDISTVGHKIETTVGAISTLQALYNCFEWKDKERWKSAVRSPHIKRGIGVATALHGLGFGKGSVDKGIATVEITDQGIFKIATSCPDIGQGNSIVFKQIAAETINCPIEIVEVITGDTAFTPDSGTSTASRSIYVAGNAILSCCNKLSKEINHELNKIGFHSWEFDAEGQNIYSKEKLISLKVLAQVLKKKAKDKFQGEFIVKEIQGENEFPSVHYVHSAVSHLAMVEVNTLTGKTVVVKVIAAVDPGRVLNRQGIEGQSEGGIAMGLGYALLENIRMESATIKDLNFDSYLFPTALDIPIIETLIVEKWGHSSQLGAKGIGEAVCVPVTAAISNAIKDAVGITFKELPISLERVVTATKKSTKR